jgi:non-ribosomal peptide synthetase component F
VWLARYAATTPYVVWLATLVALLAAESGQSDVIVGTYMTNRRNHAALQSMMGNFINLVALRFRYRPNRAFRGWLAEVARLVTEAQAHCEIPHGQVWRILQDCGIALSEVSIIFGAPGSTEHDLDFADVRLSRACTALPSVAGMPWGFSLTVSGPNPQQCWFNAEIYDPLEVSRFLDRLCKLLDAASGDPDLPVGELISMSSPAIASAA